MVAPRITTALQDSIRRALEDAELRRSEYVTLEHLLLALIDDPQAKAAMLKCGTDVETLRNELEEFIESQVPTIPEGQDREAQQTIAMERVLQRAAIHAISSEMKEIHGGNLLIQLIREEDSHAAWALENAGLDALDLKRVVSHELGRSAIQKRRHSEMPDEDEEDESFADPLSAFTTELVAEAEAGRIDPLIGREHEIERTVQISMSAAQE